MCTKLHVAACPLQESKPLSSRQFAFRVREKQNKSKAYIDHKREATAMSFQCGSYDRVRKPGILRKTHCKFSRPLRVVEQKGQHTYLLSVGCCWNASYFAPVSFQEKGGDSELSLLDLDITLTTPQADAPTPPQTDQAQKIPEWSKDFVL
ncbi:hypothetical protein LDENG_00185070 [Lucifuga dentata]|nr:hypothetical protein LDENG_00185070 [Lucifuga dentata]